MRHGHGKASFWAYICNDVMKFAHHDQITKPSYFS